MERFNTPWGMVKDTPSAFQAAARYHKDAKLLRLAQTGMRPLEVGNYGNAGCSTVDSSGGAGHGRPTTMDPNAECAACPVKPPRCDCHVIGGNTLGTPGIATGATAAARFGSVTIDSGDAGFFVPYYMYVTAFQFNANNTVTGNPVMVLLTDSKSGQEPNLRRASTSDPSFGIATLVYGREKELECVDWRRFASVNNQQLSLTFYNPRDFAVHVFVALWGIPAAG
jgi:hypothetical protein